MTLPPDLDDAPVDCADEATIARLYTKMSRAAVAKAYTIVRRHDVAAEIAHDTFVKLWQGRGRFPNDRAVYVWIFKTCHRAAIDHVRSAAYRREHAAGDQLDEAPARESRDALMDRELVRTYVDLLKPLEAEAFLYAALDGMTHVEIADVMGTSRRTVQRLLEKAQARFAARRQRDA